MRSAIASPRRSSSIWRPRPIATPEEWRRHRAWLRRNRGRRDGFFWPGCPCCDTCVDEETSPDEDLATGSWTLSAGSDFFAAVDDEPDSGGTDYVQSELLDGNAPAGSVLSSTCKFGLETVSGESFATGTIKLYAAAGDFTGAPAPTRTLHVELYEGGATLRAARDTGVLLSFSPTSFEWELTSEELDSITDFTDLEFWFYVAMGAGPTGNQAAARLYSARFDLTCE